MRVFNFALSKVLAWTLITIIKFSLANQENIPGLDPDYALAKNKLQNLCSDTHVETPKRNSCPATCRDKFRYNFYTEKTGMICYSKIIKGQVAGQFHIAEHIGKGCECGLKSGQKRCTRPYRIVRKKIVAKGKPECSNVCDDVAVFVQVKLQKGGNNKGHTPVWCHYNVPDTLHQFKTIEMESLVTGRLENGKFRCWCGVPTNRLQEGRSMVDTPDELPPDDVHELPTIDYNNTTAITNLPMRVPLITRTTTATNLEISNPEIPPLEIPIPQFRHFPDRQISLRNRKSHLRETQSYHLSQNSVSLETSTTNVEISDPKNLTRVNPFPQFRQLPVSQTALTSRQSSFSVDNHPSRNQFLQKAVNPVSLQNNPEIHPSSIDVPQLGQPLVSRTTSTTNVQMSDAANSPLIIPIPQLHHYPVSQMSDPENPPLGIPIPQFNQYPFSQILFANRRTKFAGSHSRENLSSQLGEPSVNRATSTTNVHISDPVNLPDVVQFPQFNQQPVNQTLLASMLESPSRRHQLLSTFSEPSVDTYAPMQEVHSAIGITGILPVKNQQDKRPHNLTSGERSNSQESPFVRTATGIHASLNSRQTRHHNPTISQQEPEKSFQEQINELQRQLQEQQEREKYFQEQTNELQRQLQDQQKREKYFQEQTNKLQRQLQEQQKRERYFQKQIEKLQRQLRKQQERENAEDASGGSASESKKKRMRKKKDLKINVTLQQESQPSLQ